MTVRAPDYRRDAREVIAILLRKRTAYTPTWTAEEGDPGRAVVASYASMLSLLWERLNQAPDKNQLQFLADLGIDSLPPAAARAPVVIEPLAGNALAPAGSLVGATSSDGEPLTFRTEFGIGLSASPLAEVRSVVPQRDTIASHSVEIAGGRDAPLFLAQVALERFLFVGHSLLLALDGESSIELELEFLQPSRPPLEIAWSIWDGASWRAFESKDVKDNTKGMTQRGTIRISAHCIKSERTEVDGVESFWLRGALGTRMTPDPSRRLPVIDQLRIRTSIDTASAGQPPDSIVAAGVDRDPQEPVEPFGSQPRATSIFHAAWDGILARAGAQVKLTMQVRRPLPSSTSTPPQVPHLAWEYRNGREWTTLPDLKRSNLGRTGPAVVTFTVPADLEPVDLNGRTARWIRARIASRSYDQISSLMIDTEEIEVRIAYPPTVSDLKLAVLTQSRLDHPDQLVAEDISGFRDGAAAVRFRGTGFEPFLDNGDRTPTVYFGFDGDLPAATIGMYFDILSTVDEPSHEFRWERFDGRQWVSLPVEDETAHLTRTGITRVLWPGNRVLRRVAPVAASGDTATVITSRDANTFVVGERLHLKEGEKNELAVVASITGGSIRFRRALANSFQNARLSEPEPALFGVPRTWIRARLTEGEPPTITVRRLLVNAVWASESSTIEREILGSGTNLPGQLFRASRTPILEGEKVQVRELSGARARTDLELLQRELNASGQADVIETDLDPEGDIIAVWVTWQRVTNLRSSGPDDRHYVVNRAAGQILFGDGVRGRAAPTGIQNIRLRRYATGGGQAGNVAENTITTAFSGIIANRVWNPVGATGGADPEPPGRAATRAPRILRHRYQAVSAADYRDVAIEASPEVFDATVTRVDDDLGDALRLLVLPLSAATPPEPSAQLLEAVRRHLVRRCAVGAASRLRVLRPTFVEVGVHVEVAPVSFDLAGQVFDRVRSAIIDHLHPVRGGPHGLGWRFGSTIHVARFAPVLESVDGVDFVTSVLVTARGAIIGDAVVLAADELPSPGIIRVTLTSPGSS